MEEIIADIQVVNKLSHALFGIYVYVSPSFSFIDLIEECFIDGTG